MGNSLNIQLALPEGVKNVQKASLFYRVCFTCTKIVLDKPLWYTAQNVFHSTSSSQSFRLSWVDCVLTDHRSWSLWLICRLYWQTVHCKCKTQKVNSYKLTHARCTNILLYTEQHTHIILHTRTHTRTRAHTHRCTGVRILKLYYSIIIHYSGMLRLYEQ